MSTVLESPAIGRRSIGAPVVIATVLALAIGVAGGSLITRTLLDRPSAVEPTVAVWDAGKLEAMQGRVLAAAVPTVAVWDAGKLEAMQGRVLAAAIPAVAVWDAGKLEAMQGRVLAAGTDG